MIHREPWVSKESTTNTTTNRTAKHATRDIRGTGFRSRTPAHGPPSMAGEPALLKFADQVSRWMRNIAGGPMFIALSTIWSCNFASAL